MSSLLPQSDSRFEKEKKRLRRAVQKKIKRIQKGLLAKEESLEKSKNHEKFKHIADVLKSHFHLIQPRMETITLEDWAQNNKLITISLDPKATPEEQIKKFYKQVKKLRCAQEPLEKAIHHLREELQKWQNCLTLILECTTEPDLTELQKKYSLCQPVRSRSTVQTKAPDTASVHRFLSASGYTILVGKNAIQNSHLTFQIARGDDIWLHAHQVAGSHVIIRKTNLKDPIDHETVIDAAHLALHFSKARSFLNREQEVLITERRYVERTKGAAPGKVVVRQYKILKITLDPKRIETLKSRTLK